MAYPSHMERDALRKALRSHPNAATVLNGERVSNLSRQELVNRLLALGLDPRRIARDATYLPAVDHAAALPCVNPPHQPEEAAMIEAETIAPDAIEAEVQTIRSLIVTGGFSALDDRLRDLVREAHKPAVTVEVIREVQVEAVPGQPVHSAKLTGNTATWRTLFDVRGPLGKATCQLWDGSHPNTPTIDDQYVWPSPQTTVALSQIARKRNIYLWGPAGTGKTEWAEQLAARTGRPFALISCDNGTDAATLVGMTTPDPSGGVSWQDGQLTRAIRTPGCVVLIDEPAVARPGALMVLQNVLANRVLYIAETGARIPVAPGVVFVAADNTNGTGGGGRRGYTDTNRLNAAFLDRFGVRVRFDYLPEAAEIGVLVARTGCTPELAKLLVGGAALTRAAADNQTLSHGIGLRRLIAWAEVLTDGIDPETAFKSAVLDCAPEQDMETLREQLLLTYDKHTVTAALNPVAVLPTTPDPTLTNPTPAGRSAAADFGTVHTA